MPPPTFNLADFVYVDEMLDSRPGSPFNADGTRDFTRKFLVVTLNKFYGASAVCMAPGLPLPYAPYQTKDGREWDLAALLVRYSASQIKSDDKFHWEVTADYSTKVPEGGVPQVVGFGSDVAGAQNQPWLEPPEIEWDFEVVNRTPRRDLNRKAFVNSANQPFKPAPTFETARAVLVLTRNEQDYDRARATSFAFALNKDLFLGCKPGTVQCMPPRAKQMWRGSIRYWRVTYRLRFGAVAPKETGTVNQVGPAPQPGIIGGAITALFPKTDELETWQPEILDAGLCYTIKNPILPYFNQPVPIIRHGVPVSQEVLLDGTGLPVAPNAKGELEPVYLKFYIYQERVFAGLLDVGLSRFGGGIR